MGQVHAEVVGLLAVRRAPHLLQQLALGDELALVADEHLEQLPLDRRQVDRLAGGVDDRRGDEVDGEVVGGDDRRLRGRPVPAHGGPQPGEQLVHAERLGDVVVGAGVEGGDLVAFGAPRRQHDDGHVGPAAEPLDHLDPVDAGQPEVEQHDVGVRLPGGDQRLLAGRGQVDLVAACDEVEAQRPADRRLVVDDEHAGHRADRQPNRRGDAAAGRVVEGQLATHRVDEAAGDRQPEPEALRAAAVVEALERFEEPDPVVLRQSRTTVDDADVETFGRHEAGLDRDRARSDRSARAR